MNSRDRFLATMAFEPVDRALLWEWDYWPETLRAWRRQGAPLEDVPPADVHDERGGYEEKGAVIFSYPWSPHLFEPLPLRADAHPGFSLDPVCLRVPLNSFICPLFEYRILEERADVILAQDPRGHIRRDKRGGGSVSNIVKTLVSDREDWERVKVERLALTMEGRLPPEWPQMRAALERREAPLAIGGHSAMFGFYHAARYLLGPERLLYGFYDQPALIKDIMNRLADLYVFLFDRVLSEISVDLAFITEDIGYNAGPFISPGMFREFLLPAYRRVVPILRDHGVKIIMIDSDGNNWPLIPAFLEAGMTAMGPMEVAGGMDVVQLRAAFPKLQILGGLDKRAVIAGPQAIDQELEAKLPPLLDAGGYLPMLDHATPPDVTWRNFIYYRQKMEQLERLSR